MDLDTLPSFYGLPKPRPHRGLKASTILKPLFEAKPVRKLSSKDSNIDLSSSNIYKHLATDISAISYEGRSFSQARQRSPSIGSSGKKATVGYSPETNTIKKNFKLNIMKRLQSHIETGKPFLQRMKTIDVVPSVESHQRSFTQMDTQGDEDTSDIMRSYELFGTRTRALSHHRPSNRAPSNEVSRLRSESFIQTEGSSTEKVKVCDVTLPRINKGLTARDLVFGPNVPEHILKKHATEVLQGIRYAMERVNSPSISQLLPRQLTLRKKNEKVKKTLVLDLDETLITTKPVAGDEDNELPMIKNTPNLPKVRVRPYAEQFLREMSKEFEIIIFTAAEQKYAEYVIKLLDPERNYVSHILHRDNCLKTRKGLFIKDLRLIKNRDLKDMVIVDNFTPSFSFQIDNGIPIITWEGDLKDQELKYLMSYLREAKHYDDMRQYNRERLRLTELNEIQLEKFLGL